MKRLLVLLLLAISFPAMADVSQEAGAPGRTSRDLWINYPPDGLFGCSIAIGQYAMPQPAIGSNLHCNIGVGYLSLGGAMTNAAVNDICFGPQACRRLTSGNNDIAIGYQAGGYTTGSRNISIGTITSQNFSTGNDFVHVDPESSLSSFSGGQSVVFGTHQGYSQIGGTILGMDTFYNDAQSGNGYNTGIGPNVARTNIGAGATVPTQVLLIGATGNSPPNTLLDGPTTATTTVLGIGFGHPGQYDTTVGYGIAIANTTDGNKDAAYGYQSLNASTTGVNNSAYGYQSCKSVTTGSNNLCIGENVGSTTLTTGSSNILIGTSSAVTTPAAGTSNMINIANLIYGNNTSTAAPAVSSCGGSPAIDAHANAKSGTITVGTGSVTSCTVTFASAYNTWNHCRVTFQNHADAGSYSYTTGVLTLTGTNMAGKLIDYDCDGY